MKKLSLITGAIIAIGCGEQTHSNLDAVIPSTNETDAMILGEGYKGKEAGILSTRCVTGDTQDQGTSKGKLELIRDASFERILDTLSGSISAELSYPTIKAEAGASYAKTNSSGSLSETYSFFWKGTPQKSKLTNLRLSDKGKELVEKFGDAPNLLYSICGDEYVSEIHYGASLIGTLKVDFFNEQDKKEISGMIAVDTLSIDVKGELEMVDAKVKSRTKISISFQQVGGEPSNLFSILGRSATSCTFQDPEPCLDTMKNFISYSKGDMDKLELPANHNFEGFAQQLENKNSWGRVRFITQKYIEAGITDLVRDVGSLDRQIVQNRKKLQQDFIRSEKDNARADLVLSRWSDLLTRSQYLAIEDIRVKSSVNSQNFYNAINVCYSQPGECNGEATATYSEEQKYDSELLLLDYIVAPSDSADRKCERARDWALSNGKVSESDHQLMASLNFAPQFKNPNDWNKGINGWYPCSDVSTDL